MSKIDFAIFEESFAHLQQQMNNQFQQQALMIQGQIKESELRLMTRLGFLMIRMGSIMVATLTWLIKL